MAHPSQPHQGARFEIVRQHAEASDAQYDVRVHHREHRFESLVALSLTQEGGPAWGPVRCDPPQEDAQEALPAWIQKHANALLRQCLQQARNKGSWPRRIRRWRDAPKG